MIGYTFILDSRMDDGRFIGWNSHTAIPIGAIFSRVMKIRVDGPPVDLTEVDLGLVATVNLELREVDMYRKKFDFVPPGYSAAIGLSGEGVDQLAEILRLRAPREWVHLKG